MTFSSQDAQFMRQALELARKGTSLTSPGARVGAVIVDAQCNAAGSGFYTFDGIKHAEVLALEQAGARSRGGTIYLNLEPHCHQGRTPPCTDALVAAGIKRVIAAMADPNPLVAGKGFDQLRAAGVEVKTGLLEAEARRLNEAFAKYILTNRPLITLKSGMTLDGKIAPPPSEPSSEPSGEASSSKASSGKPDDPSVPTSAGPTGGWITSAEARAHVHELRHESDAIMVGVGTVLADDPLLTDRTGRPRRRSLLRVVVDSRLRLPLESRLVKTANADLLVFCSFAEEKKRRLLEERGVRVEQVALGYSDGRPDLYKVAARLGEMEMTSLLIEGGALLNWTALAANMVDKVFLYYAPKILGGEGSVPFASGAGYQRLNEAAWVKNIVLHRFGEDFAVEGYLRDPYAGGGSI